jgi:hypothetical protein
MARIFAGILGTLGFLTALARGLIHGSPTEPALWSAWWSLLALAAVGYVIGWIGGRTVEEAVTSRVAVELEAHRAAEATAAAAAEAEA